MEYFLKQDRNGYFVSRTGKKAKTLILTKNHSF